MPDGGLTAEAAERMKAMRTRRRDGDRREVRLLLPHLRRRAVRERIAHAVASLNLEDEVDALAWIEEVGIFDERKSSLSR